MYHIFVWRVKIKVKINWIGIYRDKIKIYKFRGDLLVNFKLKQFQVKQFKTNKKIPDKSKINWFIKDSWNFG